MNTPPYLSVGPRLTIIFVLLVILILGGNALLVWQFHAAGLQTERLTSVSQQSIAIMQLQECLLLFHHQMEELARSRDADRLVSEAAQLRKTLLEQTQRTRRSVVRSSLQSPIDPSFIPILDGIETTLPSQLDAIVSLAKTGDWGAVHVRLGNELKPVETLTSALMNNLEQDVNQEHARALEHMRSLQRRILLIIPATAILTFSVAALFGWSLSRRIVELRIEERVAERTEIARELHDTLLQGFMSASMQLHVAVDQLPADSPATASFARVLQLMGRVIEEGRNTVRGFRAMDSQPQELERAFSRIPQEVAIQAADYRVIVEGSPRALHPVIRDGIYRICREAVVNAFRHAAAEHIEVVLAYGRDELRVSVRDDGRGIDPSVLHAGREGHWGLPGMRERAEQLGATLKLWSRAQNGTEVELRVPGGIAFNLATRTGTLKAEPSLRRSG